MLRSYDPFNNQVVSYALQQLKPKTSEEVGLAIVWLATKVNAKQTQNDPRVQAFLARVHKDTLDKAMRHKPRIRVQMRRREVEQTILGFSKGERK